MKLPYKRVLAFAAALGIGFILAPQPDPPFTGHGDPAALTQLYQRWKNAHEQSASPDTLQLGLSYSKALSARFSPAAGRLQLNLRTGRLQAAVSDLPATGQYELWLLDNHSPSRQRLRIGQLEPTADGHRLAVQLDPQQMRGFTLDAAAIVQAGTSPDNGGLLFGSPSLLQRLYFTEHDWPGTTLAAAGGVSAPERAPFEFLLPKTAQAGNFGRGPQLAQLIARGQKIFTEETFGGNGRTCATCHRPDNNHTIDPNYIAKLPKSDPLFVAETRPELADLEKPALLRQFALFVANADGFDRPPVMRSASHLLGLANTLTFERAVNPGYGNGEFTQDEAYFNSHDSEAQQSGTHTQAIGWSGDGAPDGGSLRDFAKGAIKQHMPKTLIRAENIDFRLPTEDELDALEAYMLSLGRSSELNLANMYFKSPLVQNGLLLFNTKNNPKAADGSVIFGATANCNGCHFNAGGISSTTNANPTRDTGVERMRDQLHHLADPTLAYDGGFGQLQQNDCGPNYDEICFSDGSVSPSGTSSRPAGHHGLNRFNTPSLVEAADTAPFFHNNSVTTLEESVAYYSSDAFNSSPGAFTSSKANRQGKLDSSQVIAVALFLRSINVLENIRSSNLLDKKAMEQNGEPSLKSLKLAIADTQDAVEVLQQAVINPYPEALEKLQQALNLETMAGNRFYPGRIGLLRQAIALKEQARNLMVSGG
ncbi:hypothetical protein [Methylomonas koyamae]|uniref:Cytochrome c domain-containing protein n=1 Tax=Methylomonas koyamae TaxID=702114 RepID=A0AA91DD32_9GAMM|nr:hypothetical protein [Methylomonas koyamae]OAI25907.1 hypothetical protein A1356_12695 [Methylomonas koyamae]